MLKKQLYLVYLLALLIPISIIGSILMFNTYNLVYTHHEDMLTSDNIRIRSIMFEVTTLVTNIGEVISEDEELQQLLSRDYTNDDFNKYMKDFTLLKEYFNRHTEISTIDIYTENETIKDYEHIVVVDSENRSFYNQYSNMPGYQWISYSGQNDFGVSFQELRMVYPINVMNSDLDALLVIGISNNYLKNRIENNNLDADLAINDEKVFFSTWGNEGEKIEFNDYEDNKYYVYSGANAYKGDISLLEVSTITPLKTTDSIYVFSKDPFALSRIREIMLLMILTVIVGIAVPLIVIITYTKQLTNRVDTLRTEMHRVTNGDYNIIETFKGNDELVELFNDLQIMIQSIKERDQEIFDGELRQEQLINHQQNMKMEILASKINPHFLYNTLETIRMMAFGSNDLEVATAVKLLGKYMRYNLESTGQETTLEDEVEYTKIYLDIQNLRFKSRISTKVQIDDRMESDKLKILPLIIQPLVENAYIHGHSETIEDGIIHVNISESSDRINIDVIDNGKGIDKDKLNALTSSLSENKSTRKSFGLYNIHHRLTLFYDNNEGLMITSEEGKGTTMSFSIPKRYI